MAWILLRPPFKNLKLPWVATNGKIPTKDMLKRRSFRSPSRCSMCLKEEEFADHLLVHCWWVSLLWDTSLSNRASVQPSNVRDVVVA